MNKIRLTTLAILMSITGAFSQPFRVASESEEVLQMQKMNQVLYLIANGYVDTVNMSNLVEAGITGMLSKLDPHSAYIDKEEFKRDNESFGGNFEGIGIEFNVLMDTIIVVNTIPGGPSELVGLLPGDRIISVNGDNVVGAKMTDVPKILRGPKGTEVNAEVVRHSVLDPINFKIIRDRIPMNSLDAAYVIEKGIGYIKLNRFSATTNDELQKALLGLKGIDKLILDLRGNGGGLLDQAIGVTSNFLAPGNLVVYTEGRSIERMNFESDPDNRKPLFEKGKLVVLVDENSASASEIVAGAIQDWDRGTIVGRRTFGKGLVQQQIPLIDGSAIRLTAAHYYTPAGRSIQRPYTKGDQSTYYHDIIDRYNSGEITSDMKVVDSTLVYKTLIKGRTVYGGGGILPDVIVPADTTAYSPYWSKLVRASVILEYVINDLDKHRSEYESKYTNFETFDREFTVSAQVMSDLVALAQQKGIDPDPEGLAKSEKELKTYVKALLAGRIWNDGDFYRVMNRMDKAEIEKAIEILKN